MHNKALLHYDSINGYHRHKTCLEMRDHVCSAKAILFEEREDLVYKVIKFFKKVV